MRLLLTKTLVREGITVLVNAGFRLEVEGAAFWVCGVDDHMVGKTDLPAALKGLLSRRDEASARPQSGDPATGGALRC